MSSPLGFTGPDLRGYVLDQRYQLDAIIGSGGSGDVYAAADRKLRRPVAVKVIHPEHSRSEEQRRRIRQEGLIGAQLNHPNIAPILDFGEDDTHCSERLFYLVMPRLDGHTLRHALLDGTIPWKTAALWTHQLLRGVAALHAAGALHRDIKPDNCILARESEGEVVKLLDLGLAKLTRDDLLSRPPRSVMGQIVGSLPYLSPEQALGEEVDEQSDVYSVGVVLYELLTRRPPFLGSDYEVLVGHVEREPPAPREVAPLAEIPAALETVVCTALSKSRRGRFASAADLDAALVAVLSAHGVDVAGTPAFAGCGEAQASLAAWSSFDRTQAEACAAAAAKLNRAWSPLMLLLELLPEG